METRVNRKRKTKSFRQGCPFEVHITILEDGKYLQVNRISATHNHALQKQIYERFPRPSYVQRQGFSSAYQRLSQRPSGTNKLRLGPGIAFK